MRAKRLLAAAAAVLSVTVGFTVFTGTAASADLPYCLGTYHIQANNGMYVSNRENEGGIIKAVVSGNALGTWERFRLFRHALSPTGPRAFAIRASNDNWVIAWPSSAGQLYADYVSTPGNFPHDGTFMFNDTSDPPNGTFQPFKSRTTGRWVANEEDMGGLLRANRVSVGAWERFRWVKLNSSCQAGS